MKITKNITKLIALALLITAFGYSCHKDDINRMVQVKQKTPVQKKLVPKRDLEEIKRSGKIVLLTENSSTSYYLYKGQALGFDYEWANQFAKHLGVKLEVRLIENLNEMFDLLERGEGDLLACNLNITDARSQRAAFSNPIGKSAMVVVQRIPDQLLRVDHEILDTILLRDPKDLIRKEVYVHEYATFNDELSRIEDEFLEPIYVIPASGSIDTEQLIRLVSEGQISYTISDENMARLNRSYYPNIDVEFAISEPKPVACALRQNQPDLLKAMNNWLSLKTTKTKISYLNRKYFLMPRSQMNRVTSAYSSLGGNKISVWDQTVKRESKKIGWDWRLVSALINQESRFDPDARSWVGAFGLMQLMPSTAERFGVDTTHTAESNIRAGIQYIEYLENFWKKRLEDQTDLTQFVLASYNVGPGHVLDAQKIATALELNPEVWENNVDICLLKKMEPEYYTKEYVKYGYCRGKEPYHYVQNIMNMYQQYAAVH